MRRPGSLRSGWSIWQRNRSWPSAILCLPDIGDLRLTQGMLHWPLSRFLPPCSQPTRSWLRADSLERLRDVLFRKEGAELFAQRPCMRETECAGLKVLLSNPFIDLASMDCHLLGRRDTEADLRTADLYDVNDDRFSDRNLLAELPRQDQHRGSFVFRKQQIL
ncbi:protein of unknown function [Candidatus Methylomirabilis oxygeniifera]|uniref:Uncharacterized protein n=1 Tax=Methylomirabilis oxygeniifera TaxID=671143 RepID=D5MGH6_METO1|nr:protein of unknown function [Candidatus Methylomirabilis oxyfera]